MKYTTRIIGAPYGMGGEHGEDTDNPQEYAQSVLQPGQRLLVWPTGANQATDDHIMRFVCSAEFGTTEVCV